MKITKGETYKVAYSYEIRDAKVLSIKKTNGGISIEFTLTGWSSSDTDTAEGFAERVRDAAEKMENDLVIEELNEVTV